MIFVTLGTHPQQFNRLLKEVETLIEGKRISEKVFAQTGYSDYKPKGIECKDFLSLDDFRAMMKKSSLVITHAGEGNIGLGKNIGKKMIIVPRKKEFSEHTNDHQLELAHVCEEKKLGLVAWNISELGKKIVEAENFVPAKIARGNISQLLEDFLGKEFK